MKLQRLIWARKEKSIEGGKKASLLQHRDRGVSITLVFRHFGVTVSQQKKKKKKRKEVKVPQV